MRRSSSSLFRDFCDFASFFSGKNDVPHPGAQRCLLVWACRVVSAGKGFNQWFFRLTLGYGSRILPRFQCERRDAAGGLLQASDPIPQRAEIFIVKRQFTNVFIKLDRTPQANFRLFMRPVTLA